MIGSQPLAILAVTVGGLCLVLAIIIWRRQDRARHAAYEAALRQSATALRDVEASIDAQVQARTRDLRRRSDLFRGAAAVARDLTGMHDEDELIHSVAEMICRRFDIDRAAVFLTPGGVGWSAETVLVLKAVFPLQGQALQVGDLDLGAGPESAVWGAYREGEPRINHGMGSEIALPLRLQDHGDATSEAGHSPRFPNRGARHRGFGHPVRGARGV